jgi:uncharacterized DUF497 family protein
VFDIAKIVGFDWDAGIARKNDKHNVSTAEAEQVFFTEPLLIVADTKHSGHEARLHALGQTDRGRLVHVAFAVRDNKIRVISARDMHRRARATYAQAT